jgi:hypothetical protein
VLVLLSSALTTKRPNQTEATSMKSWDWGCGKQGQCWTHCSYGTGWCYNSAANTCTASSDCSENDDCIGDCNWYGSSVAVVPEVTVAEPIATKNWDWGCGKSG